MRSPTVTPQLQRMAAQAAHDPDRVFTTLASLIAPDLLREAYRQPSMSNAAGIDGVTAHQYAEHLDANLCYLPERLRSGRSQAAPVERVWIEQDEGGQRPIGQPTFEDKTVQRAVAMLLEAIDEQDCTAHLTFSDVRTTGRHHVGGSGSSNVGQPASASAARRRRCGGGVTPIGMRP